uniref:Uncharacterized protein n=1 Tax=Arundo donax TaxID=35708 RepID=A0A0A9FZ71_ARUDO
MQCCYVIITTPSYIKVWRGVASSFFICCKFIFCDRNSSMYCDACVSSRGTLISGT